MRSKCLLSIVVLCSLLLPLVAQPDNDDCIGAFALDDITDWCSEMGAFTTQSAGNVAVPSPSCFSGTFADVWFTFTPLAADVTITIISSTGVNLLEGPEVALYLGNCEALQEIACAPGMPGSNVNSLYFGGLSLGLPHYLRIQGATMNSGDFQLCINNYNPPEEPSSDCPEAALLCSKEPFVVQKLIGPGNDATEANDAPCLNGFSTNVEWHSAWFMWTAGSSGSLTFTLTPLNPPDDLDFVVYEFPNGPGDCSGQIVHRCMASSCDGPTGLNESSADISEPPNCNDPSQDNFLAALQMETGKTYGMMVNNFSSTGIGFEVEFGGSGQIAGPEPAILNLPSGPACVGETITLMDASTFPGGNIVGWEWSFGPDASIASAQTAGPHEVSWSTAGLKPVLLRLLTNQGCMVSIVRSIEVLCCDAQYAVQADITHLLCPGDSNGAISVQVSSPHAPYTYDWSNGEGTPAVDGLPAGWYGLTITDGIGCDTILNLEVESPPAFVVDTALQLPGCSGGMDGGISLMASGATPPYLFSWEGGPFLPDASFFNLPAGDYEVEIRDANGCELMLDIPLRELTLELAPASILPPSCYGSQDGSITLAPLNGQPPYQYDFSDGNGWVGHNTLAGLSAGTYTIVAQDANQCEGSISFLIEDPPPLTLSFSAVEISCAGAGDGQLEAQINGGSGSYTLAWNNGSTSAALSGLTGGTYALNVMDGNGCSIQGAFFLSQPPELILELDTIYPVRCHAEANGGLSLSASGGTPPFEFALEGQGFQLAPFFANLAAGEYTLLVRDGSACRAALNAVIEAPPPLQVEAGGPVEVVLGHSIQLQAQGNGNGLTYSWQPAAGLSCTDCPSPSLMPLQDSWYTIRAEDEHGCIAKDSVRVVLSEERPVFIPNAFSPNDDGRNDYFTAYLGPGGRRAISIKIYNRWGVLAFSRENLSPGIPVLEWDGRFKNQPAPSGVYTYVVEVEFIDGETRQFAGSVSLLR